LRARVRSLIVAHAEGVRNRCGRTIAQEELSWMTLSLP
jgi:hypothetical protein